MNPAQVNFDDGAAYETFMGTWSQLAGATFLDWLAPPPGLRWLDVGCGNGVFTEMLLLRCAPATVRGIDPSPAQIEFARGRPATRGVRYDCGDAMALPYADASFDAAVMALVIFFVPDPARGLAEMARVVAPGGSVSAYAWDMATGGFPYSVMHEEMTALGAAPLSPPSLDASRSEVLRALWQGAGLIEIETRAIAVQHTFADFEAFWRIVRTGPRIAPKLAAMASADLQRLQDRMRERLPPEGDGRVTCQARANAIRGHAPR